MKLLLSFIVLIIITETSLADRIKARFETEPTRMGIHDSDDAAYYHNNKNPMQSEILGVSKCDEQKLCGGLYIYDLKGKEKQFLNIGELNNVDTSIINDINYAFATNREDTGLSVFKRNTDEWKHLSTFKLRDSNNKTYEPYGLCSNSENIAVTTKVGLVFLYKFKAKTQSVELVKTIDLKPSAKKYDDFIIEVTTKTAKKKNKLHKLAKYLKTRYVSEACVFHKESGHLFIAEEKLGIWRYDGSKLKLFKKIQGSFSDLENTDFTDDVEGLSIYKRDSRDFLTVSSQGISKILFIDINSPDLVSSHSFYFNETDPITNTDGVLTVSEKSELYPEGFMVVHDDENTTNENTIVNANYKIIDMKDVKLQ